MLIDWFTILAQVINFLILVGLLKYFLYNRVLQVMDQREHALTTRFYQAETKQREAEQEAERHRQLIRELEDQRRTMLARAKQEADTERAKRLQQARDDIDSLRAQWRELVNQEKSTFFQNLRRRLLTQIYDIARHALHDLANTSLENHLTEVFLERLTHTTSDTWLLLRRALEGEKASLVIQSAFALPLEQQHRIQQILREHLDQEILVHFEIQEDLICGIALCTPGHLVAWNLDQYLESLIENISVALREEAASPLNGNPSVQAKGNNG